MSRIVSSSVQVGNSYVIGNSEKADKDKEQENALILNAKLQAEEILKNAHIQANQIIENANVQANELLKNSHEEGFKEGYKEGYAQGFEQIQNELVNHVNNMDLLAKSSFDVKQEIIQSSEPEIVKLAIVIAERVIRQQLDIKPELILNIIKAAISELKDKEEVKIIVHPSVTQILYDFSDDLKIALKGLKSIKVIEDKTVPPTGVIVESPESRIDARLETQIAEITKSIYDEVVNNPVLSEIPKEIEIKIEEPRPKKEK